MASDNNPPPTCDTTAQEPRGFWQRLMHPPKCSMLRMIVIGLVGGVAIWGTLNTAMEWTNRSAFCMSCHEMTIPFEELKKTVHYKNRSGTTVQCADCHVASSKTPTDYMFKSLQKLMAARDVIGHIKGTLDTPELYEEHRFTMAKRVWLAEGLPTPRWCWLAADAQTRERVADGGLGHGQVGRGAGQVAFGHHFVENAQQVQVKCPEVHRVDPHKL